MIRFYIAREGRISLLGCEGESKIILIMKTTANAFTLEQLLQWHYCVDILIRNKSANPQMQAQQQSKQLHTFKEKKKKGSLAISNEVYIQPRRAFSIKQKWPYLKYKRQCLLRSGNDLMTELVWITTSHYLRCYTCEIFSWIIKTSTT